MYVSCSLTIGDNILPIKSLKCLVGEFIPATIGRPIKSGAPFMLMTSDGSSLILSIMVLHLCISRSAKGAFKN